MDASIVVGSILLKEIVVLCLFLILKLIRVIMRIIELGRPIRKWLKINNWFEDPSGIIK